MTALSVCRGKRARLVATTLAVSLCGALPAWAGTPTTTALAVTSGGNPVTSVSSGSVVTLTATVKAGTTAVKPGTVNFCNAAATYCTDITLLGSAQLTANGTASIKFKPGVGGHSYKAVFVGTTTKSSSSSAARPLTVTGLSRSETVSWPTVNGSDFNFSVELGGNASAAPSGMASLLDASNGNAEIASAPIFTYPGLRFLPVNQQIATSQIVAADFNGDGIPDLAITQNGPVVEVFLGNGDGTFTSKSTLSPVQPDNTFGGYVSVGNFNNHGIPDIVYSPMVGNSTDQMTIFLGKGDGTFASGAEFGQVGLPLVGDFNGDGNLDIAQPSRGGIFVWLGNGNGTFAARPVFTLPGVSGAFGLDGGVAGDFDGDGKLDLASDVRYGPFGNDSQLVVYFGNGDGTFRADPIAGFTEPAGGFAAGDLTGNGRTDLVMTEVPVNSSNFSLVVHLTNGDGTFTSNTYPLPNSIGGIVTVADYNQAGLPDLSIVGAPSAAVLIGKGDGTFTLGPSLSLSGESDECVASADFNGDGVPDLAVCDYDGYSKMKILLTENKTASADFTGVSVDPTHKIVVSFPGDAKYKPATSQPMQPCHVIPKEDNCG